MPTKAQLCDSIAKLEPNNSILRDSRATHDGMVQELKSCKRRKASSQAANATPCVLRFRLEDRNRYSWKLFVDDKPSTDLGHGMDLPQSSTIHPDYDGRPLVVMSIIEGLDVVCGDLSIREEFDPRRVYTTLTGSSVAYKRVQEKSNMVVLWSYKHGDEIALGPNVPLIVSDRRAQPTAQARQRKTQKNVSAWLISKNPSITGEELTAELRAAFPENRVEARHGPHYICLSRKGKLPEPPDEDPREW